MNLMSRGRSDTDAPHASHHRPARGGFMARLMRIELFTLLTGGALLLAALALYLGLSGNVGSESRKINDKEYQAVFLNSGQVYFGKIKALNSRYVDLTNVFYIENNNQTNTTSSQNTNYTLRKLGTTELHAPEDEMLISKDQVTFWENLKDSGQVVTKIKEYYQNPSANTSSSNSQSTTSPQSTTPSTTPSTTTP